MGASSQPEYPFPGGTPGALPPDPQPGKPGHFAFTRWIREFARRLDAESVKRSGDTMTGALTVLAPTAAKHPATKEYVDGLGASVPIGAITAYGGTTAPTGWHLCDGTAHGSSALQAVLGSANTPDLRGRFIVGAGGSYARGDTGGLDLVVLTSEQSGLRPHNHWADPPAAGSSAMSANAVHAHSASVTTVQPKVHVRTNLGRFLGQETGTEISGTGVQYLTDNSGQGTSAADILTGTFQDAHNHGVGIGQVNIDHSHTFDIPGFAVNQVAAANANQAHENRPPYYALVYIIKKA